jgi:hypothetical protein
MACLFPLWKSLAFFGYKFFPHSPPPFGTKSPKRSKTKGLQGKLSSPRKHSQREMLNALTMIHKYDINEDTTCANN